MNREIIVVTVAVLPEDYDALVRHFGTEQPGRPSVTIRPLLDCDSSVLETDLQLARLQAIRNGSLIRGGRR